MVIRPAKRRCGHCSATWRASATQSAGSTPYLLSSPLVLTCAVFERVFMCFRVNHSRKASSTAASAAASTAASSRCWFARVYPKGGPAGRGRPPSLPPLAPAQRPAAAGGPAPRLQGRRRHAAGVGAFRRGSAAKRASDSQNLHPRRIARVPQLPPTPAPTRAVQLGGQLGGVDGLQQRQVGHCFKQRLDLRRRCSSAVQEMGERSRGRGGWQGVGWAPPPAAPRPAAAVRMPGQQPLLARLLWVRPSTKRMCGAPAPPAKAARRAPCWTAGAR